MGLEARAITAAEHRAYVVSRPSVPLQQTPGWGKGFVAARTESVGWFDDGRLIGAGLYRMRGLPRLPMRSVAVFESGPDIDWTGRRRPALQLRDWMDPLVDHLRERGVFTARINPVIMARQWWGVDPSQRATSKALVHHAATEPDADAAAVLERLRAAGWRPLAHTAPGFLAEIMLGPGRRVDVGSTVPTARTGALAPGLSVRPGTVDDLEQVAQAVAQAHSGLQLPPARDWTQRWRGLASDDLAGVSLLVCEREGAVVYGGLCAVVGERAWDLSTPLPLPDASRPEVQVLRQSVLAHCREAGARTVVVPTIEPQRRAPVPSPAPGWPPVHLVQLVGTWHFPVRATWHGVLAPVVDRLVL